MREAQLLGGKRHLSSLLQSKIHDVLGGPGPRVVCHIHLASLAWLEHLDGGEALDTILSCMPASSG